MYIPRFSPPHVFLPPTITALKQLILIVFIKNSCFKRSEELINNVYSSAQETAVPRPLIFSFFIPKVTFEAKY